MYSYNHQRHEGVPHDLGIRTHQLTLGTRPGMQIGSLVPRIHVSAAEGGQRNNTQSGALSSCFHGREAEWPNWTNNDRFCRPSLGRSLAWYTSTGSNGCQSLEYLFDVFCYDVLFIASWILYILLNSYSFSQFHSGSHLSLDVSERVSDVSGKMIFALVSKLSFIESQVLAVITWWSWRLLTSCLRAVYRNMEGYLDQGSLEFCRSSAEGCKPAAWSQMLAALSCLILFDIVLDHTPRHLDKVRALIYTK